MRTTRSKSGRRSLWLALMIACSLLPWASAVSAAQAASALPASTKRLTVTAQTVPADYLIRDKRLLTASTDRAYMIDNRLHVPLRLLGQALQQKVIWSSSQASVRFEASSVPFGSFSPSPVIPSDKKAGSKTKLSVLQPSVTYYVSGKKLALTQAMGQPFMYKDRLYVPLRFLAEAFGQEVGWEAKRLLVTLKPANTSGTGSTGDTGSQTQQKQLVIDSTETKLRTLQTRCKRDLTALYDKYNAASAEADKKKLINEGVAVLNTCDLTFNFIMSNLNDRLRNIGEYPDAIVEGYRRTYEEQKQKNYDTLVEGG